MRLLQHGLGEGAHQPQRRGALLRRPGQEAALLRHLEERVGRGDGGEEGLLAGRRQLLRQVAADSAVALSLVLYFSVSVAVIRNPTPSLRRPLQPSHFCVGMSETRRNSPPGLPGWAIFPAQSGNPNCSARLGGKYGPNMALQFTAQWILYVDY